MLRVLGAVSAYAGKEHRRHTGVVSDLSPSSAVLQNREGTSTGNYRTSIWVALMLPSLLWAPST